MSHNMPENLKKYFLDCDFSDLSMDRYAFFITERILNYGDMASIKWLLAATDRSFTAHYPRSEKNRNHLKMKN